MVEFFERKRLRLGHEEEDKDEADDVPAGIPTKGTLGRERIKETRERDRDYEVAGKIEQVRKQINTRKCESTTYKNHKTDVESDIPMSRTCSGYASAEYVNGTGPSPGEYAIAYKYTPRATTASRPLPSGIQNEKPVMSKKIDINGNVVSRRLRRPNVSMV